MLVVGVVGSPRKSGRTSELVDAALTGAAEQGAEVQKAFLVDYDIKPFIGQGGSEQGVRFVPEELSALCFRAEALVVGAPVYFGDINGLTKDFMDSVRIQNENGKPALGIAIAGGSGKGLLSGVQSIYHWFYHRQMRAIDPTPVTRFNMAATLDRLPMSGSRLVEMAEAPEPFAGEGREDRWEGVLAYYATLPYFDKGPVDEFLMLAEQLVAISAGKPDLEKARAELAEARAQYQDGDRVAAGRHAVRAYELLVHQTR